MSTAMYYAENKFSSEYVMSLEEMLEIELWRGESGFGSDLFYDIITLLDIDAGCSVPFPVQRWCQPNVHCRIKAYDTSLPQDDKYPHQRNRELRFQEVRVLDKSIVTIHNNGCKVPNGSG